VTLVPLAQLSGRRDELQSALAADQARAAGFLSDASQKLRDAAAILVAQRDKWQSAPLTEELSAIDVIASQIDDVDRSLKALSSLRRRGFSGFFQRFSDRRQREQLISQRNRLAADVAVHLESVGERAPSATVPDADALLTTARAERREASAAAAEAETARTERDRLEAEIRRRQDAQSKLGFDSLWLAAWLTQNDPPAIETPVALQRGEAGWLNVPAVLSRQTTRTRWAGGSQGVSIPVGHTGIRYRVGSFSGHPIQSTVIADVDRGSLVLTNQRLVFVGQLRSVTIALKHIVHVEAYTDALAVFQDRRETPDFFKMSAPQYLLLYLNFAINRQH